MVEDTAANTLSKDKTHQGMKSINTEGMVSLDRMIKEEDETDLAIRLMDNLGEDRGRRWVSHVDPTLARTSHCDLAGGISRKCMIKTKLSYTK